MRTPLRLLALALALPLLGSFLPSLAPLGLVRAQDGSGAGPTGQLLLSAVGERGDRVLHFPDFPAFLAAAEGAGLGPAKAWRAAFRDQVARWSSGEEPQRMQRGAEALLAAADGEVLLFSLPVPAVPGCGSRGTVLVIRTSATEAVLKRALEDVIAGGLGSHFGDDARAQQIGGRTVLSLTTNERTLFLAAQDGLVAAADHPLALGLVYRGLETATSRPHGKTLLTVRRGARDRAWTGWMVAERESLSGPLTGEPVSAPAGLPDLPVALAVAMTSPGDMPFLPAPPPAWVAETPATGAVSVLLDVHGGFAVAGSGAPPPPGDGRVTHRLGDDWLHLPADAEVRFFDEPQVRFSSIGGAARLGWLAALARGRLALPVAGLAREALEGPLAAAEAADAARSAEPFVPWEARDTSGELRGPAFRGPVTFLALRLLHDTLGGTADDGASGRAGGVPLPPPRDLPPLPPTDDGQ